MNLYRLLRSNKESGPYTQEDMIALGFKPYDLIWVEGKSAGWRYPSELPEFKMYAAVTEEQPFDRFYKKKPIQETIRSESNTSESYYASSSSFVPKKEEVLPESQHIKIPTVNPASIGRHIHVTLPSGSRIHVTTVSNKKEEIQEKISEQKVREKEKVPTFAQSFTPNFQPVANEIIPASKPLEYRNAQIENSNAPESPGGFSYPLAAKSGFSWTVMLGLAVGIATFVGLGLMIGLSINKGRNSEIGMNSPLNKKTSPVGINKLSAPSGTESIQKENIDPVMQQKESVAIPTIGNKSLVKNPLVKYPGQTQNIQTKNEKAVSVHPTENQEIKSFATEEPIRQRYKSENEAMPPPINLEKQINVVNNAYRVGAFGGIYDLQCTINNESKYSLDEIEVEISYVQANDKIFKTEKLSFRDVGAGSQITLSAPKSPRGIKVITRVTKISSKEYGLSINTVRS